MKTTQKATDSNSPNTGFLADVLEAVQECRAKLLGDPQRIVVVLAPSGYRLSTPYAQTLQHRGAVLVAAGALDKDRVRFVKVLAHRTRVVPVLLATVEDWRRWKQRRPLDAAQIRRRTHLLVELEKPAFANN